MNKFLILLIFLISPFSLYASDVYYCVDDAVTGFSVSDNYEPRSYKPLKFKMKIDFENYEIVTKEFAFIKGVTQKCFFRNKTNVLYCSHDLGTAFSINKRTLEFHRSNVFMTTNQTDDIYIAHGSCEKF